MALTFGSKPAEFKYVELPWEAIAAAGAARQKRYDEGDKEISNINDTFLKIGSIAPDTPRKKQLVDDYQQQIYEVVDSYSGDIGAALPKIKELQRKINYDITYGELGAINNRYKGQQESIAEIQKYNEEYIKSGGKNGMSGEEATALLNYETNELNNAAVQKNPDGTWTTYKKYDRMPTIQMFEEARQIAANMKPQMIEQLVGLKPIGGGFYQHGKETKKYLEAEAIQMAVEQTMRNDPRFTSYLKWRNEITGKNKAVANYLQQNLAQTPEGIPYLPGKDAAGNEIVFLNPYAWQDEVLHEDFRNAAADAGRIFQQLEISRDRSYMHVAPREPREPKEDPYKTRSLNVPNTALSTTIQGLQTTVGKLAQGITSVPITKDQALDKDGKVKPGVRFEGGKLVGQPKGLPAKRVGGHYAITMETYEDVTKSLNSLDKTRLDYVIKNGSLKGKKPSTTNDWKQLEQDLAKIGQTVQYSGVLGVYENAETRRTQGAIYNTAMPNFMFYDETGEITNALPEDKQRKNRLYSGTELRQAGIKITELTGKMSTSSSAPKSISGPGGSYTFAAPDVVLMQTPDGREISGLVGRNKNEINGGYIAEVLESSIKASSATGLPEQLFSGSNYIVSPNPTNPYSFSIQKYDKEGNVIENIDVQAGNEYELRQSVIQLWNADTPTSAAIRNELNNNLLR